MCRIRKQGILVLVQLMPAWVALGDDPSRTRNLSFDPQKGEWVEVLPPEPGTPEGDLHAIRELINDEEYRKAIKALDRLAKEYGSDHPVYPQMLIARAQAQIGREEYDDGLETVEAFLSEFAGMGLTPEALRLGFVIAEAYLGGAKREFLGLKILSGEDTAMRILDDISIDYPEEPIAELAIKTKGDYLFRNGDHALAELEYARMLQEYSTSRYHQFALVRTAESALASHGGVEYDEAALIEAEERYFDYRRQYPGPAERDGVNVILDGIREQRAEKDFITGQYYERTEHFGSAVFYYQSVLANWPDTLAAGKAARRLELIGLDSNEGARG